MWVVCSQYHLVISIDIYVAGGVVVQIMTGVCVFSGCVYEHVYANINNCVIIPTTTATHDRDRHTRTRLDSQPVDQT